MQENYTVVAEKHEFEWKDMPVLEAVPNCSDLKVSGQKNKSDIFNAMVRHK